MRREIAVGMIVAEDGRLLFQHRDDDPTVHAPGMWGLFGGHLEEGEEPAAAFLRELEEELGWRPSVFEPWTTREVAPLPGDAREHSERSHVFAAQLDVGLDALTLGEGQAMQLAPPDAVPSPAVPMLPALTAEFAATPLYRRMRERWDWISTTGLLVDRRGRFLLQLRDDRPDIVNPGVWGSFGGRLEPYETPEQGFLRELEEELAWRPASVRHYSSGEYRSLGEGDTRRQLIHVFVAEVDVPLSAMTLGEGQDFASFAADALPENTVPALRRLIRRYAREQLAPGDES